MGASKKTLVVYCGSLGAGSLLICGPWLQASDEPNPHPTARQTVPLKIGYDHSDEVAHLLELADNIVTVGLGKSLDILDED